MIRTLLPEDELDIVDAMDVMLTEEAQERERERSYEMATPEMFIAPVIHTEAEIRQQMRDMLGEDAHFRKKETAQAFAEEAYFIDQEDAEANARRRSEEEGAEPDDEETAD